MSVLNRFFSKKAKDDIDAIPFIQYGEATGSVNVITVTFQEAFSSAPKVVASAILGDPNYSNRLVTIKTVSTTGFTAKVTIANDGGSTSASIQWIAIGTK